MTHFCRFFEDIPFAILQRLADVDYRKSLMAGRMYRELIDSPYFTVFGILGTVQALSHTVFGCISTENFDELVPAAFLRVCFKYYYPQFTHTLPGCQYIGESKGHPAVCSSLWFKSCLSTSSRSLPQKFSEE